MAGESSNTSTYIIATVIFAILYFLHQKSKYGKYSSLYKLTGPIRFPIVGTALQFLIGGDIFMKQHQYCKESPNGICLFWFGNTPSVALSKADTIEPILTNQKIITKEPSYVVMHDWLGTGILCSAGEKWFRRRKLFTPTFHLGILETFLPIMVEKATILVEKLSEKVGERVDIQSYLRKCTLDVIYSTAMGVDLNAQDNADLEYVAALDTLDQTVLMRVFRPWLMNDYIFSWTNQYKIYKKALDIVHVGADQIIAERKKLRKLNPEAAAAPNKKKPFLDMLLDTGELSDKDLKEEVNTFMFAGHDTTSVTTKWCLFLLGLHEDIQERIHEELDELLPPHQEITFNGLKTLKYLERCIKESLRIYPSVPFIGRYNTENIEIKGFKIPVGAWISLNFYTLHRDEKYWPDPELFDPDRFLPENSTGRHPYAYLPFSAGSRNCIGQKFGMLEAKVIVALVLQRFKVKTLHKREDIHVDKGITLSSKETMYLRFTERIEE